MIKKLQRNLEDKGKIYIFAACYSVFVMQKLTLGGQITYRD